MALGKKPIGILLGVLLLVALALFIASRSPKLHTEGAIASAVDAYIYGYPLVTFDSVRRQQTNVARADGQHAPMGQMIKMRSYPAVDNHCCAAPNADTLYTLAWLDVGSEPWVLSIPDMGDRYYIVPFLDGFSEVIGVASPSGSGSGPRAYAVTGPGWSGTLPKGVTQLKSHTALVWILGRIYSTGTEEDYAVVHELQDQFGLVPLSSYGKPYSPPPASVDPDVDMKTSVRAQVNAMDIYQYFEYLAELLRHNPPKPEDAAMVASLASIGLVPGKPFDPGPLQSLEKSGVDKLPVSASGSLSSTAVKTHFSGGVGLVREFDTGRLGSLDKKVIQLVPKIALLEMALRLKQQDATNGWLYFTDGVGNWGTDYLLRGMANMLGPGWNRPRDAIYPISQQDAQGDKYDGAKYRYVAHFGKGQLPPADAFWSLTIYDENMFFVPNSIDRFSLSQRDSFLTNADGSVDFYIQAEPPAADKVANWLPAPRGHFQLVLRLYSPATEPPTILDGSWVPPAVVRID